MPANVTAIHSDSVTRKEIDVREHQQALLDAEADSLTALESCSKASASLVAYLRLMGYSTTHPRVRKLMAISKDAMNFAYDLSSRLSDGHKVARGMADAKTDAKVVMSGGIFKDDTDGASQEFL
jgi:hypothetical protein